MFNNIILKFFFIAGNIVRPQWVDMDQALQRIPEHWLWSPGYPHDIRRSLHRMRCTRPCTRILHDEVTDSNNQPGMTMTNRLNPLLMFDAA